MRPQAEGVPASTGPVGGAAQASLVVTSFNIRTAAAPDGAQAWSRRKDLLVERIRAANPDLLGLQECRQDAQAGFLRAALPDYEFIGVPRQGEGDSALEMAPLLYRRGRFEELGRGHFWLSATPAVPGSRSWGADYPRTVTWVKLRSQEPGAVPLVFINTHFDYAGTAPEASARLLRNWMAGLDGRPAWVICGDFNAERGSAPHAILTGDGRLRDALAEVGVEAGSFHDFGRAPVPEAIDWILVSPQFQVLRARVDEVRAGALYPSDHFPVTAVLLPPKPKVP